MAYVVIYNSREVRCDTADDVRALLGDPIVGMTLSTSRQSKKKSQDPPRHGKDATASSSGAIKDFVQRISPKQRELLNVIVSEESVSGDTLRQRLHLTNNRELGSLLIGISKIAKVTGIKASPVETATKRSRSAGRMNTHAIKGSIRQPLAEALGRLS